METIRILGVGDPAVYTYQKKADTLIQPIEDALGIHIDLQIVSFAEYYETLMDAFEHSKYDIVMVAGHLWLPFFVEQGYVEPICEDKKQAQLDDVLETIKSEMFYKQKQYLYPCFCDGHILAYRKNRIHADFKDTVSIIEVMNYLQTQTAKNQFALKAHPSELFLDILPYFRALAIEPIDAMGRVEEDDAKIEQVVSLYQKAIRYCEPQVREFGNEQVCSRLQSGAVDMAVTWGGQLGAVMDASCVEPEQMGFAALEESWNVTWSFGLNAKSKKKDLAIEVMKRLTAKSVDQEVGRTCGNPTRLSNFLDDQDRYPWYSVAKTMIERAKPLPSTPFLPEAISALTSALDSYLHHEGA